MRATALKLMIVNFKHPVGHVVPGEAALNRDSSVAPHPPSPFEVREKRAQAPADRMGMRINFEAINLVPDKLIGTAILAHHHRLAGAPALEYDDAKGLVAAWHAHHIKAL